MAVDVPAGVDPGVARQAWVGGGIGGGAWGLAGGVGVPTLAEQAPPSGRVEVQASALAGAGACE